MKWNELHKEACPVARGLSVVGDRWTMLVLRDCFLGVRRFEQMRRELYQQRPQRYEYRLTERGKALYPMLVSLIDWANAHVPPEGEPSVTLLSRETGDPIAPVLVDANTGKNISHRDVKAVVAE